MFSGPPNFDSFARVRRAATGAAARRRSGGRARRRDRFNLYFDPPNVRACRVAHASRQPRCSHLSSPCGYRADMPARPACWHVGLFESPPPSRRCPPGHLPRVVWGPPSRRVQRCAAALEALERTPRPPSCPPVTCECRSIFGHRRPYRRREGRLWRRGERARRQGGRGHRRRRLRAAGALRWPLSRRCSARPVGRVNGPAGERVE